MLQFMLLASRIKLILPHLYFHSYSDTLLQVIKSHTYASMLCIIHIADTHCKKKYSLLLLASLLEYYIYKRNIFVIFFIYMNPKFVQVLCQDRKITKIKTLK